MKNIKSKFLGICIICLFLISCSINLNEDKNENCENKNSTEYSAKYICPMHCEGSGADTMSTCPTCKMDYVKNEKQ